MKYMKKKIPNFKTEKEERTFWAKHDSAEYLDWKNARRTALPNLKPSVSSISLRLPQSMLQDLKLLANKQDVPYQSLMKIFLAQSIRIEFAHAARTHSWR